MTTIIFGLKQGDSAAAERLWALYFDRLVAAARRKLGNASRRAYDEEDVALSVFDSLCRGAERGQFTQLSDRDDLWALLLAMTKQKAVDRIRRETRQKRGGGDVAGESVFLKLGDGSVRLGIDQFIGDEPTPEFLTELQERHRQLLDLLPNDEMRQVALLRMDGYQVKEIAGQLGYTTRWAERKLERIRSLWVQQLEREGES